MTTTEIFLIAMLIIFSVPYLIWRLFRTDHWAPLVIVQIICGVLLGPGILGAISPAYYDFVFTPTTISYLNSIAWWAVMIFVWIAGIELDFKSAWNDRRASGITASFALGVPLLIGCGAGFILLAISDAWVGKEATTWQFILSIGMACAVTALPILILLMEKLDMLRRPLGQRILRYASLDDIAIWAVLALILLDWERVGRQGIFIIGFTVCSLGFRQLMQRVNLLDRWYLGLIWLAICGFAADWAGLHYMVGAFLAGVVMDSDWFPREDLDKLRFFILLTIMPVYFLSTGLRTSWDIDGSIVFIGAAILLVASVGGKLIGVHLAGRLLGWQKGEARLIGWLLQTKALIMIIFANVLLDKDIITNVTFTALLLMAIVSTMLTIPMVSPQLKREPQLMEGD
jgi:Kef-type K+ transport system membrane component KefB